MARARAGGGARAAPGCETVCCSRSAAAAVAAAPPACSTATHAELGSLPVLSKEAAARGTAAAAAGCEHQRRRRLWRHCLCCLGSRRSRRYCRYCRYCRYRRFHCAAERPDGALSRRHEGDGWLRWPAWQWDWRAHCRCESLVATDSALRACSAPAALAQPSVLAQPSSRELRTVLCHRSPQPNRRTPRRCCQLSSEVVPQKQGSAFCCRPGRLGPAGRTDGQHARAPWSL